jgi:hypothetical protein
VTIKHDFHASIRAHEKPVRLVVTGDIDTNTHNAFQNAVDDAADRYQQFILDLTSVTKLCDAAAVELSGHRDHLIAVLVPFNSATSTALRAARLGPRLVRQPRRTPAFPHLRTAKLRHTEPT